MLRFYSYRAYISRFLRRSKSDSSSVLVEFSIPLVIQGFSICLALRRVVVLRGACLFTILLVLLQKEENDFSTSFSIINWIVLINLT